VLLASVFILINYAAPFDVQPARVAEFSVPAEGAARISVLAAFMIVLGAAGAAIAFSLTVLRGLTWTDWLLAGVTFAALTVGAEVSTEGRVRSAETYPGLTLFCIAAEYTPSDSAQARAGEFESLRGAQRSGARGQVTNESVEQAAAAEAGPRQQAGVPVDRLRFARWCSDPKLAQNNFHRFATSHSLVRFMRAHELADLQYALIVLAFSGLVVGAICCLRDPRACPGLAVADPETAAHGPFPAADERSVAAPHSERVDAERAADLAHWEHQSARLNACLYLGALLLGSSLLFIGAFLRWPLYALLDAAPYADYVNAMLAYYGSTFSVMLVAFYVPAAAILSVKVRASAEATTGEAKLPEAFQGPLQLVKIVVGLGGTAFAGALPQIIDMIG
jgi:hypothetical protein